MRETNDQRMFRGQVHEAQFDGMTRAKAISRLLDLHNHEYYKALGQTLPRKRRGLGRTFGELVSPLAAVLALAAAAQVLPWTGKPNTAAESAAVLAGGDHWSNASRPVAPLPEGVVGTPLPGSPIVYYWTTWWPRTGYGYGFGRSRGWRR